MKRILLYIKSKKHILIILRRRYVQYLTVAIIHKILFFYYCYYDYYYQYPTILILITILVLTNISLLLIFKFTNTYIYAYLYLKTSFLNTSLIKKKYQNYYFFIFYFTIICIIRNQWIAAPGQTLKFTYGGQLSPKLGVAFAKSQNTTSFLTSYQTHFLYE